MSRKFLAQIDLLDYPKDRQRRALIFLPVRPEGVDPGWSHPPWAHIRASHSRESIAGTWAAFWNECCIATELLFQLGVLDILFCIWLLVYSWILCLVLRRTCQMQFCFFMSRTPLKTAYCLFLCCAGVNHSSKETGLMKKLRASESLETSCILILLTSSSWQVAFYFKGD